MTRCALHNAELLPDRRYTTIGVSRCPRGCEVQDPGGYSEKARRPCGLEGCNRLLPRSTGGRPRMYCSPRHTNRAAYLRRRTGQGAEGVQ